jgi:hypothetical protein
MFNISAILHITILMANPLNVHSMTASDECY